MRVHFNDLPRSVRERFVQISTANPLHPSILAHDYDVRTHRFRNVLAVLTLVAVAVLAYALLTHGDDPSFIKETYAAFAIVLYLFLTAWLGIAYSAFWPGAPYREGTYVFGGCVVKTHGEDVGVVTMSEWTAPAVTHKLQNYRYTSSTVFVEGTMFLYFDRAASEDVVNRILAARRAYIAAYERRDVEAVQQLDPFYECTVYGQWKQPDPGAPRAKMAPGAARAFRWVGSLILAGAITGAIYAIMSP